MQAYFFDIVTADHIYHDFHGRKFGTPQEAHRLAEMIALDIECSNDERPITQVEVRDVKGGWLYGVNVSAR
jgi:hypothetical protein